MRMEPESARDFASARAALYGTQKTGAALQKAANSREQTVEEMRHYVRVLGLDLDWMAGRTLHITGTKGKGSTAAFCDSIMRTAHGKRTGLFT